MTTEQQQVAMIRTMLFFMGKSQYGPTAAVVLTKLREMSAASEANLMNGIGANAGGNSMMGGIGNVIGNAGAAKPGNSMMGGIGGVRKW